MEHFTQLTAWKNGLDIVKEAYSLADHFPRNEQFELSSQIRKSSTSILANIAEGFGRYTYKDKAGRYVIA